MRRRAGHRPASRTADGPIAMAYEDLHGAGKASGDPDRYPDPAGGPAGPTHRVPTGGGSGVPTLVIVLALVALLAIAALVYAISGWARPEAPADAAARAEPAALATSSV